MPSVVATSLFVVDASAAAGELTRAILGADKALDRRRAGVRRLRGQGRAGLGSKSLAVEVQIQPQDKTLTDAEIEALSGPDRRGGGETRGAAQGA